MFSSNGIIENYQEIKNYLIENGIKFKSSTDTEVIVNLLAFNYKKNNNFLKAINETINLMTGTWGLVILNKDEPNKLYCLRYGSPLLISKNENIVLVSSEQSGFNGLVNNYFVLEPNDICVISIKNEKLEINTKKI